MNAAPRNTLARRTLLKVASGIAATIHFPISFGQGNYPSGTIRLVMSVTNGGSMDAMMRIIGQKLTESWGKPVIVMARPGANGTIAASDVAEARPDGLTLLVTNFSLLSATVLRQNPGYKLADFVPISIMVQVPIAIGVRPSLGVTTLEQYVRLAKANPGKYTYGTWGPGSGGNFLGEQLNESAGINTLHVPYKGEAPAIQALLGGQIDAVFTGLGTQMRQGGKVTVLAVTGSHRFGMYPDVPTFAEAGYPDPGQYMGWNGLFAPAATPKPVVDKLSGEVIRILKSPDIAHRMLELGFDPVAMTPAQSAEALRTQLVSVQRMVREGRVKP